MPPAMAPPLLAVDGLTVEFAAGRRTARVLSGVSLTVARGETLGIVGESGCGKSMTALAILRLVPSPPGNISAGSVRLHGEVLLAASDARIRDVRGNRIAMIFQEPMTALNPVFTVGDQIAEGLGRHLGLAAGPARARAIELLAAVGIPAPGQRVDEYPHQLSGGMRPRVMIAMAIACEPELLIADEPTTALDVTVQAQILDLMRQLQEEMGMAILIISHDLGVIADLAEEVVVMYAGKVVERGAAEAVFYDPQHPYTRGLLRAAPVMGQPSQERLYSIPGTVPSPLAMPRGCAFRPRCPERFARCVEPPELIEIHPRHLARCWAREAETHA